MITVSSFLKLKSAVTFAILTPNQSIGILTLHYDSKIIIFYELLSRLDWQCAIKIQSYYF
ncbi:hypothetical protein BAE51_01440 [Moraxella catarrhalis]|nr:hypothetical protein BAE51_01440 [Moraxella catarrhalis]